MCLKLVLVNIRKKGVFEGGSATCGLKKVLIAVVRFLYCSFHLFQVGQIVSTSTTTCPNAILFSAKVVGARVHELVRNSSLLSR